MSFSRISRRNHDIRSQAWTAIQKSQLLTQFEREEIETRLCGMPPKEFTPEWFMPRYDGQSDSIALSSILAGDFLTYNTASVMQTWADVAMVKEIRRRNQWELATIAWKCGLLPEGHIVRDVMDDSHVMVMKVRCFSITPHVSHDAAMSPQFDDSALIMVDNTHVQLLSIARCAQKIAPCTLQCAPLESGAATLWAPPANAASFSILRGIRALTRIVQCGAQRLVMFVALFRRS
jgi:hypothetical protein